MMSLKSLFTGLGTLVVLGATSVASANCPAGTQDLGAPNGKTACLLSGSYMNTEMVLTNNNEYVLEGGVFFGNDNKENSVLRIQAGTKIYGKSGADYLVITRGSKIFAQGTADAPIVMTSAKAEGQRQRGDWGGLIINGNAPINGCDSGVCEAEGEGATGFYGGTDAMDSSGVLKYLRVEFAGNEITPDNELNGIAFQGVGAGTEVDYIQVHMNSDDGVEFFGGTVNVKHVVLTGNKDDSMDWTSGWQGKAQFVLIEQYADQANNGIEADNLKSPMNAMPRSFPTISNMTMIGTKSDAAKGGDGILLRVGTGASITNTIVTGFKKACLDIDDAETFRHAKEEAGIEITNTIFADCGVTFKDGEVQKDSDGNVIFTDSFTISDFVMATGTNYVQSPELQGYMPTASSIAMGNGEAPFDFWFEPVDYIGAFEDSSDDWASKWTIHTMN